MHKCHCGKEFKCPKPSCSFPYEGEIPCQECYEKAKRLIQEWSEKIRHGETLDWGTAA